MDSKPEKTTFSGTQQAFKPLNHTSGLPVGNQNFQHEPLMEFPDNRWISSVKARVRQVRLDSLRRLKRASG